MTQPGSRPISHSTNAGAGRNPETSLSSAGAGASRPTTCSHLAMADAYLPHLRACRRSGSTASPIRRSFCSSPLARSRRDLSLDGRAPPRTPAGATLSKGSLRGFTAAKRIRESASPGAASHHLKSSSLIVNVGTVSNDSYMMTPSRFTRVLGACSCSCLPNRWVPSSK